MTNLNNFLQELNVRSIALACTDCHSLDMHTACVGVLILTAGFVSLHPMTFIANIAPYEKTTSLNERTIPSDHSPAHLDRAAHSRLSVVAVIEGQG